jgi:hypothetical protein
MDARRHLIVVGVALLALAGCGTVPIEPAAGAALVRIGEVFARNSINTVVFRQHALTTHERTQFAAYYDQDGHVVVAMRQLGSPGWRLQRTHLTGNVGDAHNAISIAVDGDGYLHLAWNHHGRRLHYVRSTAPGSLEFGYPRAMTGRRELAVTYPEFSALPGGDLLFVYRDGIAGEGDTMLNRYDVRTGEWRAIQHPLIDGQGERSAYTNGIVVDGAGRWHLSWCWRETEDVATNHDLCYAVSVDQGATWQSSDGTPYPLPIRAAAAEVAWPVAQGAELMNTGAMAVTAGGRPLIATWWREPGDPAPEYRLVRHDGARWHAERIARRRTPFSLSGGGTRRIPLSRPALAVARDGQILMLFRDVERRDRVSVAVCDGREFGKWRPIDLTTAAVGMWEPSYDRVLWRRDDVLHVFVARVGQGDAEALEDLPAQPAFVLEWTPPGRDTAAPDHG